LYKKKKNSHSISVGGEIMARNNNNNNNSNYARQAMDQMKYEIANEFGVNLGPDATARSNGSVGGEMTKRLVEMGKGLKNSNYN
jgi:hypothetical protein